MNYVNRTHKLNFFQLLFVPAFLAIALSAQTAFANPVIHEVVPNVVPPEASVLTIKGEGFTPGAEIIYRIPGKPWKHGDKHFLYTNLIQYISSNELKVYIPNSPRKDITVDFELFDQGASSNRVTTTLLGSHSGACGDSILHPGMGEMCDDGNTVNGDGCSDACLLEQPGAYECNDGIDNDNSGKTDFGEDFSCKHPHDETEAPITNGKNSFVFSTAKGIPSGDFNVEFKLKEGVNPDNYFVMFSAWSFTHRARQGYAVDTSAPFHYNVRELTPDSDVDLQATVINKLTGHVEDKVYVNAHINGPGEMHPGCSDGFDNDGDLLIDYPADPDCLSELDESEQEITGVFTGFDPQAGYTVGSEADLVLDLGSNVSFGDYNIVFQVWHNVLQEVQAPHTDLFPAFVYLHDVLDTVTPGSVELQAIVRNNQTMAAEAIVKVATEIHEEVGNGSELPPYSETVKKRGLGYHLGYTNYYDVPHFGSASVQGKMLEFSGYEFGTDVKVYNNPALFDNGYPKALPLGKLLRQIVWGLHVNYFGYPDTWPKRDGLAIGKLALIWKGDADLRLKGSGCAFIAAESNGASTGTIVDGRRIYNCTGGISSIEYHAINTPVTDVKLWLPDPSDPQNKTLEGQLFHPSFISRITDRPWKHTRMMNFSSANASPEQDWSDRIHPTANFFTGIKNDRSPGGGFRGDRGSGVPWEHIITLCNLAQQNCWINVPHLATDDYIQKLAKLFHHGGLANGDPFDPLVNEPHELVYPPLDPHLRILLEYSNEIWSGGNAFPQGEWANQQAIALGITKPEFNARRFAHIWNIFENEFSDNPNQIVRVAATFTGNNWYTEMFINEFARLGVVPHILAITTYFGNGIVDWVHEKAVSMVGDTVDQWFYRPDTVNPEGYTTIDMNDPYWSSAKYVRHQEEMYQEWTKRLLSGARNAGSGPDTTNIGGGFDGPALRAILENAFGPQIAKLIELDAYEGNQSNYSDHLIRGDLRLRGLGVTAFIGGALDKQGIADVYRIHLEQAWAKGLVAHSMFVDANKKGIYGYWGHMDYYDQPLHEAKMYTFVRDWLDEGNSVRHIDNPVGSVPEFVTSPVLPVAIYEAPYSHIVEAAGGDGQLNIELIGKYSVNGLSLNDVPGHSSQKVISGIPVGESKNRTTYMYLRVTDEDGDPSYAIYSVPITGFPNDVVDYNLSGANLSRALPHTGTHFMRSGVSHGSNHGINIGSGMVPVNSNAGVGVKVNNGTTVSDYAHAHNNNLYFDVKINVDPGYSLNLRNQEISFSVNGVAYSSANRYAAQTNVEGFGANDPIIFDTEYAKNQVTERSFVVHFPDSPLYENVTGTFEMRIYAFGGQWNNQIDLTELRIGGILQ